MVITTADSPNKNGASWLSLGSLKTIQRCWLRTLSKQRTKMWDENNFATHLKTKLVISLIYDKVAERIGSRNFAFDQTILS